MNLLSCLLFLAPVSVSAAPELIAKEETWVSPLWGYNTPKIVYNGTAWYAAGMRGKTASAGEAVVSRRDADGRWRDVVRSAGTYQPPTLGIDGGGRLIVAHARTNAPIRLARARSAQDEGDLVDLPVPPQMANAYYLGMAVRGDTLWLAWIDSPGYTLRLARLDLDAAVWTGPVIIQAGQVAQKPKTAWVYPVLIPGRDGGLHFAASNSPDGGEGNTYNEVWYLHFPNDALEPDVRERVASVRLGTMAFCTDLAVDSRDVVHLAYMYNVHAYGEPLPADAEPAGLWHAWRDPGTKAWTAGRVGEPGIAGFSTTGAVLRMYLAGNGAIFCRVWDPGGKGWAAPQTVVPLGALPGGPGFMDTLSSGSGSRPAPGPAIITDATVEEGGVKRNVTWALFPD